MSRAKMNEKTETDSSLNEALQQLLFSQRAFVEALVNRELESKAIPRNAFNVVTVLDSMGLLDREKIRSRWREGRTDGLDTIR